MLISDIFLSIVYATEYRIKVKAYESYASRLAHRLISVIWSSSPCVPKYMRVRSILLTCDNACPQMIVSLDNDCDWWQYCHQNHLTQRSFECTLKILFDIKYPPVEVTKKSAMKQAAVKDWRAKDQQMPLTSWFDALTICMNFGFIVTLVCPDIASQTRVQTRWPFSAFQQWMRPSLDPANRSGRLE